MVTLKRIDVGSAMRVGALIYAVLFTVFALLWILFQSLILNGMNSLANSVAISANGSPVQSLNGSALAGLGLATCGCGYLIGMVCAVIGGGIFGLLVAFSYNLIANWFGGLRVQIEADEAPLDKLKREM